MTTVRWNDEMLDQLSDSVQGISESVDKLTIATLKNEQQINSVAKTFEAIATQMTADREERNLVLQAISRQQDRLDANNQRSEDCA